MNILIKAATLVDPSQPKFHLKQVDISIKEGIIDKIGTQITDAKATKIIEEEGLYVSAGWLDSGVSFGEPGYESRETLNNGVLTAAKSGFTHLVLNTNTDPVPDNQNAIGHIKNKTRKALASVYPLGTLTKGAQGTDLAELYDMTSQGAVGFYDYKQAIENPNLLKIALQYTQSFDGLVYSFPETPSLSKNGVAHEGVVATSLGLKGNPSLSEHLQIQRDLHILRYTGGKLHIPTISSLESIAWIKAAKKEGLDVSCSVALHHLWANEEALENFDTHAKLSPPLRTKKDQKALQKALLEGVIDFVTTDHNPLDIEHKKVSFEQASYGSIGLEAAFGVLNSLFGIEKAVAILSRGHQRFGIIAPQLTEGATAHLSLFKPKVSYSQKLEDIYSSSKNSLYLGSNLQGKAFGSIHHNHMTLA